MRLGALPSAPASFPLPPRLNGGQGRSCQQGQHRLSDVASLHGAVGERKAQTRLANVMPLLKAC